jgi:hypothetical protein
MAKPSYRSLKSSNILNGRVPLRAAVSWQRRDIHVVFNAIAASTILPLLISTIMLLFLAGCKGEDRNNPKAVVEDYLRAKISRDTDTIQKLLCSEMETYLERETHTFETVSDARIDDLSCTWEEAQSVVRCQGKIVASYGAEQTEFPLNAYRVIEEDGQWKWCGESR